MRGRVVGAGGVPVVYFVAVTGWAPYPAVSGRPLPFPSIVDLLFWVAYLGWFVFLVAVVRVNTRGAGAVIDALVITGGTPWWAGIC